MNKSTGLKHWSIALLCALTLTACSSEAATSTTDGAAAETAANGAGADTSGVQTVSLDLTEGVEYDEDDAYTDWRSGSSTEIKLSGTSASVTGEGAASVKTI
ncbi:hypothetical protein D3C84_1056150 [compost metagenome]